MSALLNDNLLYSENADHPSRMIRTGAIIMENSDYNLSILNIMTMAAHMSKERKNGLIEVKSLDEVKRSIQEEIVFCEWLRDGEHPDLYENMVNIFFWWYPYDLTEKFSRKVSHFVSQIENEEEREKASRILSENIGKIIVFV